MPAIHPLLDHFFIVLVQCGGDVCMCQPVARSVVVMLDACLFGMGDDYERALAQAASIWITCVAGPILTIPMLSVFIAPEVHTERRDV